MPETRSVGQPLPRIDAVDKVRGQAIFAADVHLPQTLVGKFMTSPHAHAEILSIDTSKAEALPGVRAVITAADIPKVDTYDPDHRYHAFLARQFVVFAGQPVAAVAADDLTTAETALELIEVEYRSLPVVCTPQEAILPDSPAVSRDAQRGSSAAADNHTAATAGTENDAAKEKESPNVAYSHVFKHGDTAAAFAESDIVVEHIYTMPTVHQGYIEPHVVVAFWDRADHVTVWECVQGTFGARDLIVKTLGITPSNITLNSTEIGGGFGGKIDGIFAPLVVLLAKKASRPVKLTLTRREELTSANPAPSTTIRLKTGANKDGRLTALEGEVLVDVGAFPMYMNAAFNIQWMILSNYKFQAWQLEGQDVLTNKASKGAFRAPVAVNAFFAIESQLDEIAGQLGFDPLALRLQNLVLEDDLLPNMEPQVRVGAKEVLTALAEHQAWTDTPPIRLGNDGLLHGRGLGLGSWGSGTWSASAIAILEADGKIRIVLGTVDLTGSFTSLAQIAAEALGVSVQQIVMSKASPDHAPYAPMSAGSGTIYSMGGAVKEAALDLRSKILKHAAQTLQVTEEELDLNDEGVFVTAEPEKSSPFQVLYKLGATWFAEYGPLIGLGSTTQRQSAPLFAGSIAEVTVDPETGQVTLTRLITAQDVGKAINPLSVEGQIQGGSAQSMGIALWEEVLYDEQCQVRNPTLLDYHMPTAVDLPMIETILVEAPGGDGPYGAKGAGEPSIIPSMAAVANAVSAAIGTRTCDLPISPERVWRALNGKTTSLQMKT